MGQIEKFPQQPLAARAVGSLLLKHLGKCFWALMCALLLCPQSQKKGAGRGEERAEEMERAARAAAGVLRWVTLCESLRGKRADTCLCPTQPRRRVWGRSRSGWTAAAAACGAARWTTACGSTWARAPGRRASAPSPAAARAALRRRAPTRAAPGRLQVCGIYVCHGFRGAGQRHGARPRALALCRRACGCAACGYVVALGSTARRARSHCTGALATCAACGSTVASSPAV